MEGWLGVRGSQKSNFHDEKIVISPPKSGVRGSPFFMETYGVFFEGICSAAAAKIISFYLLLTKVKFFDLRIVINCANFCLQKVG